MNNSNVINSVQWVKEDFPAYRLTKNGIRALTDNELLTIIITGGKMTSNRFMKAKEILSKYSIHELSRMNLTELTMNLQLYAHEARTLLACFHIA
jgi:DNA repair protein RadC